MTRKDYVAIAAAIKRQRQFAQDNYIGDERSYSLFTLTEVSQAIAAVMAQDNQRFQTARFLKACGLNA